MNKIENNEIYLVMPSLEHKQQVLKFREIFLKHDDKFVIDIPIFRKEEFDFERWIQETKDYQQGINLPEGYIPVTRFIIVRKSDEKVIGIINVRHELTIFLKNFGGHIGYAISPDERSKGYATMATKLALEYARSIGIDDVLMTCNKNNFASAKVIIKSGGALENEVVAPFEENKTIDERIMQRYWIRK